MNEEQIKETETWVLYEKGRNFLRLKNVYTDTDKNYRFYNGNQWGRAKLGDVEPVQKNFIKPIVKYKVGVIHDNLYSIVYSSENFEEKEFREYAEKVCEMLNRKAGNIWEKDKMDFKGRRITKDSAINDEGIIYVTWDEENNTPINEVIKKNDIYYGNENDDNIQTQPYIIIRKRVPVVSAINIAIENGLSRDKIDLIVGDNDTFEESGEDAKEEIDNMVTLLLKMWKSNKEVHFSMATRYCDIFEDKNSKLSFYPVAHDVWEELEGSARGEGEVRYLIPNQIEVNKTEMRRVLAVKQQAYPQKVVNIDKIKNPTSISQVGGTIKIAGGQSADDVKKYVTTLNPAMMSPDVKQLQEDLIQVTRDLAGAGDIATGTINPEQASGKAILAVQNAMKSPMTEQKESYKNFIEDLAKIWLDMIITYSEKGIVLEYEQTNEMTGEKTIIPEKVHQETLKKIRASVKVDITPRSAFDKFAQEMSIENMYSKGMFNIQKLQELKTYVELLDDDSVMPKQKLLKAIKIMENEQQKIALINQQAQMIQQRANMFFNQDPEAQASMINSYNQATE